ncbi:hypothetical protein XA26_21380 [Mycolicibacterium fortuitum]|uniref:Uncharacterized protein n=2 Tax=Mycolicibacterium fortuitum TaxID=1766 RepID=A0A0N7H8E3_MYCFO|nr:hypothetical protein XA26_21380 [Mycolicibacterium fortuitum]
MIGQNLSLGGAMRAASQYTRETDRMTRQQWTEADVIAVDDLYRECGKVDETNPEVQALARRLGREPSAVAARLSNLHGAHSEPGYPGTDWHFTKLDRKAADRP